MRFPGVARGERSEPRGLHKRGAAPGFALSPGYVIEGRAMKRFLLAALSLLAAALCPLPLSAQNMTLDFPSWQAEDPGFAEWWKALIADYEAKHPGVKIKLYSIPFVNYVNQLTVRFAGRNPPDIVHLPTRNFASFASQQWLEPIDDLIKATDIPAKWSPLQSEMVWDGRTYGLLLLPYGNLLYYNEKILQDAGVKVPTTPAEWLDAMAKTTNRDKGVFGLVTTTAEHPNMFIDAATGCSEKSRTGSRVTSTPSPTRASSRQWSSSANRCRTRHRERTRPWRGSFSSMARRRSCATGRGCGRRCRKPRRRPVLRSR